MKVGGALDFERLVIHSLEKLIKVAKLPGQEIDINGVDFDRIKKCYCPLMVSPNKPGTISFNPTKMRNETILMRLMFLVHFSKPMEMST